MLTLHTRTQPARRLEIRWGGSMEQALDQPRGASGGDSLGFDDLLYALFDSLHGPAPWTRFLNALCDQIHAYTATLVLRQPSLGDRGDLFDVHTVKSVVEVYRTTSFEDDPFLDLPEGEVCTIYDRISHEQLLRSHYYNDLLNLDGIVDILALNIAFGDDYVGSLKIARRSGAPRFGLLEKSLVMRLYPHLKLAMSIYERSRRQTIENRAYARAIDQLAFGVIILNDRGHVVRVNETARGLLDSSGLLTVAGNCLRPTNPGDEGRLSPAIKAALGGSAPREPLKLTGRNPDRSLYLLIKPIQDAADTDGATSGVAIFLSSGKLERSVAIDTCASLYGLSKAEVALLTELVDGASILSASLALGISEHTARAQLRSIFSKTDTHRQAELFRLVLTSLAIIA